MMSLSGRKLLVTGAAGFIGSHLAERLVEDGARVTCLVHYNARSSIGNLKHVDARLRSELQIEFGSIEDGDYLLKLAEGHDVVLHLAALIGIPYSYVSPQLCADQCRGHAECAGGRASFIGRPRRAHQHIRSIRHSKICAD